MSRVGKMPVKLTSGVSAVVDNKQLTITGPKGRLELTLMPGVIADVNNDQVTISCKEDLPLERAKQGLTRALVANMVQGVSEGFEKKLEMNGVGYRVQAQGQELKFNIGYSHEVVYKVPADVAVGVEQNIITVSGPNKQLVGQVAAEIRALRKPEPYKGKGIKYVEETIIRKSGKSGKEATGA